MNNKKHVHIEAAVVSFLVLALLGFIDRFFSVYDEAYKAFGYLGCVFCLLCYCD